MASTRRKGVENSEIRAQLLDAAEALIAEGGVGAVTTRRLAEAVGLKRQIVHYYFGTIEDLFVALIRRNGDVLHARWLEILQSGDPLEVLWDTRRNSIMPGLELLAMALRREAIQIEIKRYMTKFRELEIESLERFLALRGLKPNIPPAVTGIVMMGITQTIAIEDALGMSKGHAETRAYVEEWLLAFAARGESPRCNPLPPTPR